MNKEKTTVNDWLPVLGALAIIVLLICIVLGAIFWEWVYFRVGLASGAIVLFVYFVWEPPKQEFKKKTFAERLEEKKLNNK